MLYLSQRADLNYELKREEVDLKKQQQEFEEKRMVVSCQQQNAHPTAEDKNAENDASTAATESIAVNE